MKKNFLICIALSLLLTNAFCQNNENLFGIRFSGFVKTDFFYDTRQSTASTGIREGHFYLYPDNVLRDAEGKDLNANPSFHILNIQTRLKGDISGPDAFGAKTSGVVEAEFFGTSDADLNGFRLRHAYVTLDWSKLVLMIGQNWHPLFPAEGFPGTISFNTGAPFVPFSRNPQVRLSFKTGNSSLQLAAYSQRDFVSPGPDGNSNKYLRNSSMPGLNLQAKIPVSVFSFRVGADYKTLRPELRTPANYETKTKVGSLILFSNILIKTKPVTLSMMGTYAQNGTDIMMLGGYGVSAVTDALRQKSEYSTLNSASFWIDLTTNGSKVNAGLFSGFSSNLGASEDIAGSTYARGNNVDHIFRVSPRVTFTSGKVMFASEVETTSAAYGTMQNSGKVTDTNSVTNVRFLLSAYYRF